MIGNTMSSYNLKLIYKPTASDWMMVKTLTLDTVGLKSKTEPTQDWKHKLLAARHSPIRELRFIFSMDIPYWVSVHLCRHVHAQPYVRTQRNDRQKDYDRRKAPQDTIIHMDWSMNAEELMTIANKRLCSKASDETRAVVNEMCNLVLAEYPEFYGLLVPSCQYYGTCHEMYPCGRASHGV